MCACVAVGYNYAAQYGPQPGDRILPTEGETWDPAMPEGWTEVRLTLTLTLTLTCDALRGGPR